MAKPKSKPVSRRQGKAARVDPIARVGETEPGYGTNVGGDMPALDVRPRGKSGAAKVLAPWPHIDRFPLIIGSNLTFEHISSAMREALSGYRDRFADVLAELLDQEPHGFSQLFKRVVSVAAGHFEINPVDVENPEAVEIAEAYRKQHVAIPGVTAALARLSWATYYAITGEEILWERGRGDGDPTWKISGLQMVHTRRLSYPDWMNWDLWIWDGGALNAGSSPVGGLRVDDFPGKFIIHKSQLRADYPTREGLGRILCVYFGLKRLVLRVSASEFERFIRPWVVAYFNTAIDSTPRPAGDEDIAAADAAVRALGQGYSTSAVLPDSVKIELIAAVTTLNREALLGYLDESITRACNGQSLTASAASGGSRAANEVGERDEQRIHGFDAKLLAETWQEQVVKRWVGLNYPGKEHLAPVVTIGTEAAPDPTKVLADAGAASDLGIKVNAEHVAKRAQLPIAREGEAAIEKPKPEPPVGLPGAKPGMGGARPKPSVGAKPKKAPGKAKPKPKAPKDKP